MIENKILEAVKTQLPDIDIKLETITKNNNKEKRGLILKSPDTKSIGLIIYIDDFVNAIESENITIEEAVDHIISAYNENKDTDISGVVDHIMDYDSIKDRIIYCLINYNKNEELLQNIPHIRFLDLAIIYKISLESIENNCASIIIRNDLMNNWHINKEELHNRAVENTPKLLPVKFRKMQDIINMNLFDINDYIQMYVMTNKDNVNGASVLLYNNPIWDFAKEINEDIFIIPSSIHEVIIIKAGDTISKSYIKEMIQQINRTELNSEEVLSDNLYYMNKDTGEISIA